MLSLNRSCSELYYLWDAKYTPQFQPGVLEGQKHSPFGNQVFESLHVWYFSGYQKSYLGCGFLWLSGVVYFSGHWWRRVRLLSGTQVVTA